jgi:predicted P-loop ATPase
VSSKVTDIGERTRPAAELPHKPAYSNEAEQSVLGALLLDNGQMQAVSALIGVDDFYRRDHQVIFAALMDFYRRAMPADFVTVSEYLRSAGKLDDAGGLAYLGGLVADTPRTLHAPAYALIVREKRWLRALYTAGQRAAALALRPQGQDFAAVLGRALAEMEQVRALAEPAQDAGWRKFLAVNDRGQPKSNLANLQVVLTLHPMWRDRLRLDVRSNQIVKRGFPVGEPDGQLQDCDATEIAVWAGAPGNLGCSFNSNQVFEVCAAVAARSPFNPLTDWLDSIAPKWDGERRLETFFSDFCGARQDDYTAAVGVAFFLSAIARAREPGSKVDLMLVLEGAQGARKTSLLIALAGPEFYAEAMESPAQKDFYQSLQGRWIIEIAEMQSFTKAEVSKVKQAITARWDYYRPSYGRTARNFPRQCIFVGTTNEDDYLRDPTGARRFMPVRVTDINLEAITDLREQLWAEADVRWRAGEKWWELPAQAREEQDRRYQVDSWTEPVMRWLSGQDADTHYPMGVATEIQQTTTTEVLQRAVRLEVGKHGKPEQQRIGGIMLKLGWSRVQRRINGYQTWVYIRPASPSVTDAQKQPVTNIGDKEKQ